MKTHDRSMPLAPGGGFDFSAEVSPKMKLLDDGLYHVIPYSDCHHIANISLYIYICILYYIIYISYITVYLNIHCITNRCRCLFWTSIAVKP